MGDELVVGAAVGLHEVVEVGGCGDHGALPQHLTPPSRIF